MEACALPQTPLRAKHQHLLGDDDIRRWHSNLGRGSPITADVYLRRLGALCAENKINPNTLAKMGATELDILLVDYVSTKEKQYAGSYIKPTIKAIKSWLAYNGVELKRKIKIRGADETPSLKEERVPTKDELRRVILSASKQAE